MFISAFLGYVVLCARAPAAQLLRVSWAILYPARFWSGVDDGRVMCCSGSGVVSQSLLLLLLMLATIHDGNESQFLIYGLRGSASFLGILLLPYRKRLEFCCHLLQSQNRTLATSVG